MPQRRCAFWHINSTASLDVAAGNIARKKPGRGLRHPPPVAQDFQQLRRKHDVPVFLPLALLHPNDHALTVDVGGLQADDLGDAQPRGVASCKNRPMFAAAHATQKVKDLFRAQNYRQFLRLLGRRDDVFELPVLLERDFVEESQSGDGDEDGARRQLLFIGQVNLIGSDVLRAQLLR